MKKLLLIMVLGFTIISCTDSEIEPVNTAKVVLSQRANTLTTFKGAIVADFTLLPDLKSLETITDFNETFVAEIDLDASYGFIIDVIKSDGGFNLFFYSGNEFTSLVTVKPELSTITINSTKTINYNSELPLLFISKSELINMDVESLGIEANIILL